MATTRADLQHDATVADTTPPYSMLLEWDSVDRIFVVSVPELPGCHTHGATYEEAARKGGALIEEWIAVLRESGQPVPDAREWQP
jgi:predicted RNase H-like HicB family nuclease